MLTLKVMVRNTFGLSNDNPLHIVFYYNHVHSSILFLKDDDRFEEGWMDNYT